MKGTKLLKVAFSHLAYWKDDEISMGRPTFWPKHGLKKDDIVTWTGDRAAWHEVNALQVLHPTAGLIWVQEAYLDSF